MWIFGIRFECIIHSICADLPPHKLFSVRHYTMPWAHQLNLCACVLIKELQTVAERKKKTKPKFQLGRFHWKARVKTHLLKIPDVIVKGIIRFPNTLISSSRSTQVNAMQNTAIKLNLKQVKKRLLIHSFFTLIQVLLLRFELLPLLLWSFICLQVFFKKIGSKFVNCI